MTIQTVEKRLDEVLEQAIGSGLRSRARRQRSKARQGDLRIRARFDGGTEGTFGWVERLAWQINRKRAERWRAGSSQLALPGFEEMPLRIFLRNGQRPRPGVSPQLSQVEDHVKLLRTRFKNSPRLKKMEAVLELMRRYADDKDAFGETWGDVKKKELERRDFDRLVGGE